MTYPIELKQKRTLLMVGNHLSQKQINQNVWQDLAQRLRDHGYGLITTSAKNHKLLRLLDMLFTIYEKRGQYQIAEVDVFSGPAFLWAYLCVLFLHLLKKPIILTLHGGNLPDFSSNHPKVVKMLLNLADRVITPSAYLQENLKTFRQEIQVIPNGIELKKYPFQLRSHPQHKLVWLRAFHQIYNPSLAPKVISMLQEDFADLTLLMVGPDKGDGSLQEALKTAAFCGVSESIQVIRGVLKEEVPAVLNRGDIFINTTIYESFGVSVLEAAACGLCIVTTNVGELPYLWEDGVDALLVPSNDPEAMAAAVKRILIEPGLGEKLSRNARGKAEQFDWSVVLPQWESLFQKLSSKGKM